MIKIYLLVMILSGKVKEGVQLASGSAKECKYNKGTVALQRMTMKYHDDRYIEVENLLDEMKIFNGTINVKLDFPVVFKDFDFYVEDLNWFPKYCESFSFFKCIIKHDGKEYNSLIYRPQPSELSEHDRFIVEILAPSIENLNYGDNLDIIIKDHQIKKLSFFEKIKLFFIKNPKKIRDI